MEKTVTVDQDKIVALRAEVDQFLYDQQEMVVNSPEDYAEAGDLVKIVKGRLKQIEEKRLGITRPLDEAKDEVMTMFKQLSQPLEKFVAETNAAMMGWYKKEQVRIAEQQAKIEAEAMAKAKAEHKAEVVVPILEAPKTTRTGLATITMRDNWTFTIDDELKIPREYLIPDEKKIRAAVKAGARKIPGVNIFNDEKPSYR